MPRWSEDSLMQWAKRHQAKSRADLSFTTDKTPSWIGLQEPSADEKIDLVDKPGGGKANVITVTAPDGAEVRIQADSDPDKEGDYEYIDEKPAKASTTTNRLVDLGNGRYGVRTSDGGDFERDDEGNPKVIQVPKDASTHSSVVGNNLVTYDDQGNIVNTQELPRSMTASEVASLGQRIQEHQDTLATQQRSEATHATERAEDIAYRNRQEERQTARDERADSIAEAGLTGTYNGQDTLQKKQFDLNAAQQEAQAKREEMRLDIEMHRVTAEDAAREYNRWYQENITYPLAQAQEARMRADTQLQYQKALDSQNQFAATNEVQRNQVALSAGQNAAENEIKLLPYRTGPNFSSHMANAINSVAQGSSAGVNFSGDDFTFKAPNLEKIARKATAKALAGISPYARSQISMPEMPAMAPIDFSGAPQYNRYTPPPVAGDASGGQQTAPPPPDSSGTDMGDIPPPTMGDDEG